MRRSFVVWSEPRGGEPVDAWRETLGFLGAAIVLGVGTIAWLHGLAALRVIGGDRWAGDPAHFVRDCLLMLPLAMLAQASAGWLAERQAPAGGDRRSGATPAALAALVFALLLLATVWPHVTLNRGLDGPVHTFHGQRRVDAAGGGSLFLWLALRGLRDALLGYVAALPLGILGLRLSGRQHAAGPGSRGLMHPLLALSIVAAAFGGGLTEFAVRLSDPVHHENRGQAGHAPIVTSVAVDAEARFDGLRITVPGARWMRQPGELDPSGSVVTKSDASVDPDRLYLDIAIQNLGATPREVGRAGFRLRAPDGRIWAPLADDFPALLVEPQEQLTTRLIFELPRDAARLDLVWTGAGTETHFPIADDDVAGIFASLCRSLATAWRQWSGQARNAATARSVAETPLPR